MLEDLPLFAVVDESTPQLTTKQSRGRVTRKAASRVRKPVKQRPACAVKAKRLIQIEALRQALPFLSSNDQRFALSLLGYWNEREELTRAQWKWVIKLPKKTHRNEPLEPVQEAPRVAQASNVIALRLAHNEKLINEVAARLRSAAAHCGPTEVAQLRCQEAETLERMNIARGIPWSVAWQDVNDFMNSVDARLHESSQGGHAA